MKNSHDFDAQTVLWKSVLLGWTLTLCSQNLLAWNDMLAWRREVQGEKPKTVNTVHLNIGLC